MVVLKTTRHKLIQKQLKHITICFDTNGVVTAISRSAIQLLGYPEQELLQLHALDLFYQLSDLFRFRLFSGHREVMSKERLSLKHKDGSIIDCIVTAIRPLSNPEANYYQDGKTMNELPEQLTLFLNFMNQHHWENEKQFFDSLCVYLASSLEADFVFIGYFRDDTQNSLTPVSIYNRTRLDIQKNQILDYSKFQNILSKDFYCFVGGIQEIFSDTKILKQMDVQSCAGITLRNPLGEAIGVLGFMSQQPLENKSLVKTILQVASLRLNAELEKYINKKQSSIPIENLIVPQHDDEGAIHELRNLVSTINTSIYMLKKKPQDSERILKTMENQLVQVSDIAQNLRAVSLEQTNPNKPDCETVDLTKITAEVIETQQDLIDKKRIHIDYRPHVESAQIATNPQQLYNLVFKLLSTAIQHTLPQSYILIEIKAESEHILLRIQDSGMGLDSEHIHVGLKAYSQAKSVQKAKNVARLNLSMIQDFVIQHQGRMEMENNLEIGTEIRIYFPNKA